MGITKKKQTKDKSHSGSLFGGGLDDLVISPDVIQYCATVTLQGNANAKVHAAGSAKHRLVIVARQDEAGILLVEDRPGNIWPVVLDIIPIYSNFEYTIAQAPATEKDTQGGFLITIPARFPSGSSISVVFEDDRDIEGALDTIKGFSKIAPKYSETNDTHTWLSSYAKFCDTLVEDPQTEKHDDKQYKDDVVPQKEMSSIHYVLPPQRTDSAVFVSLRRKDTLKATKTVDTISTDVAKNNWVLARMMDHENEFVTWEHFNIYAGTWNVHGSLPSEPLDKWFSKAKTKDGQPFEPDFYVIGLQEMDTSSKSYAFYDPAREAAWTKAIFDGLGSKAENYYKVASQQLVTILIVVIAKKEHSEYISDVTTTYVGVGLMNYIGNKGGVAVRLRFHDSYLCFLASHLAAFVNNVERRNTDFQEICKRIVFPNNVDNRTAYISHSWNDGGDEGVSYLESVLQNPMDWSKYASIFHNDHMIWVGDLNYRIDLPGSEIKSNLLSDKLEELLAWDQLTIERKAGRVFPMFEEGHIGFFPTYKFDAGTNNYDTSAKRRAPSWTDRILWKKDHVQTKSSAENQSIKPSLELLTYDNCMDMMLSDHKPVYALMRVKVREIDGKKQDKIRKELEDKIFQSQKTIADAQLQDSFVEFGDVQFMEYQERTLVLENTGQTVAPFRFIPNQLGTVLPPWLRVHPLSGVLGPGERTVLHFETLIDPTISQAFNAKEEEINSILILRLEEIKDFFICVKGNYIQTTFGVTLENLELMELPTNVAVLDPGKKNSSSSASSDSQNATALTVLPKEIWRLLNLVWIKNILSIDNLFLQHGDRVLADYIRRCLDNREPFDPNILFGSQKQESEDDVIENGSEKEERDSQAKKEINGANSVIDVLVALLECLPDAVVPAARYKSALQVAGNKVAFNEFMKLLPEINRNVLVYIAGFLKDAILYAPDSHKAQRKDHIIKTFTVLVKTPVDFIERNPMMAEEKRKQFVAQLLDIV